MCRACLLDVAAIPLMQGSRQPADCRDTVPRCNVDRLPERNVE
jgi:hypothetical protein